MSVLSWNCRGLGSPLAIRTLTEEVKGKNPVVVFLAETKATTDKMKGFQHKLFYSRNHCSEWWEKWWLSAGLARNDGYKIQELLALSYRCSGSQRRQGRSMGDYGIWRTSQHEQKAEFVAASRCSECSMYDAVGGMWGFQRNFAPGWKVMMEGVWCRSD